ncbi:glycosyltransferase family 61 protein [Candidatus Pelagibacter sp.]|jgi:capsular polysaccharide biosynthesis protein|nr:glycosyltransferase family 61 protein [Candidatus Pelagibacter sp.]
MHNFKKKLQFIFKFVVSKIFIILYGKIEISKILPNGVEVKNISIDKNFYKIINIYNGRIYTDYVENVAIIKENKIISDVSYQQINGKLKDAAFNVVLKKGTPRFKKKFEHSVFSLVQGASGNNNYFHWLFDIIPRLIILEKASLLKDIDFFYGPEIKEWQLDTLSIFNISKKNMIDSNKYRHIECKNLIASSHPWYSKGYILEEAKYLPKWIIDEVSNKFKNFEKKFDCNDKIYIDRRESQYNHCQIINDSEIKSYLLKKNFSIYQIGKLSFFEQIYLFNNAKIIIGAHGAAFANLIFCKPGTKVIDLIPEGHPNLVDKTICKYKNLNFNLIKLKKITDDNNGDMLLSIKTLEDLII